FGFLRFLPVRLYPYQFPYRKPDPRIFQVAADRLGERIDDVFYVGSVPAARRASYVLPSSHRLIRPVHSGVLSMDQ
ncbi:MAG: HAD family hydrolase, partial [Phycisphaerae bacterium]|nr:HAD family hydrolase [Phycisphaerae bacterium]